jgi:hypothetical protein
MGKAADPGPTEGARWTRMSAVPASQRDEIIAACRALTDAVYEGLDVTTEIRAVAEQQLGDTILLWRDSTLAAVAICHTGAGSEAGSGIYYVKFAAVRPSHRAADDFGDLLSACESAAASLGAARLVAGVNTAREEAYSQMLARGFRPDILGVAMHRPNQPGYDRAGMYVIDDWR